jgi:hypothetical protein
VEVDTLENFESEFFENLETDSDIDEIIEQIEFIRIELNRATVDDLTEIPFISRDIAVKIISYRDKIGGFKSREQVFDIPDVDDLVKSILYRNGYIQKPRLNLQARVRALRRGDLREFVKNFNENFKTYQSARIVFSNFSGGFLLEKDYGERKINDLTHLYLGYKGDGFFREFIVGSYTLLFGQGILMWRPIALGKGSDVILPAVRGSEDYISGYASTDEVKPLFGGAMKTRFKNFEVTFFYSKTNLPASLDSTGLVRYIDFSGINTTNRFSFSRNLFGGILSFSGRNFYMGILICNEKFGNDFSKSISRPFDRRNFYYGFEYGFYLWNLNLFGEIASNQLMYFSMVSGLSAIFKDLEFVFQYRNLNPNFTTVNGNVFGERYGEAWNEEGFYSGLRLRIGIMKFSGYYDIFKFPRSNFGAAKNGIDYRVEINLKVSRSTEARLIRKEKSIVKGMEVYDEFGRPSLVEGNEKRSNWRFEVENRFKSVDLKSRVEFVRRKFNDVETGFLIYQSLKYQPFKFLRVYARVLSFRSDSYWSRIYVYEDDLDGVVSLIPLYGRGLRWYIVAKYNYGKNFFVQLKYGETFFANDESVRNIFGIQLGVKF